MSPRERFGENVRKAREARKMTQEQLAFAAGVHLTEVWKVENHRREPKVTVIAKLAKGLDVPLGPLFDRVEP